MDLLSRCFEKIRVWLFSDRQTAAVQISNQSTHNVVLDSFRVIVVKDHDQWFAQSIDIDYAASGLTIEDAKQNFERGLELTIRFHIKKFGDISRLLNKPCPAAEIRALLGKDYKEAYHFSCAHQIKVDHDVLEKLPYNNIVFFEKSAAAA